MDGIDQKIILKSKRIQYIEISFDMPYPELVLIFINFLCGEKDLSPGNPTIDFGL
jgi:hypothetical protein